MANRRFLNLIIIDKDDLRNIDLNASVNALLAAVPETISDTLDHYDLAEAIQQQFQVNIQVEDISAYGPGYFLQVHTSDARNRMLHKGFVIVWNYTVGLMPWNPEHGSTAIPLRTLLTSHPLNLHLARDSHITEPYEHLTIQISGIPPHLCCNSVVYSLFNTICTIHAINFIPARIEYELSAHGQLTLIPKIAHLGIRNLTGQNDLVSIWQLSYQTFTDEMLGRLTPPGDRESELRGNMLCNHTTVQKPTHHTILITFFLAKINRIFRP